MKLAEFFISLIVDSDQKKLDDFKGGISELDKTLSNLKLLAVATAMKAFTDSTVNSTVALQNFTNQTGMLGAELQRWQIAGELSDLSMGADQVTQSIASLQQNLTQIRLGGGNVSPFQLLGVDVAGKDAFQVLEKIRKSIIGLDNATATNLIQQTGLSPQFINILRLSNEEFSKLFGERSVLSKSKRNDVLKMGTSLTNLKIALVLLKDQIVAFVAPALISISKGFKRIVDGLASFIDGIENVSTTIKVLAVAIGLLLAVMNPIKTLILASTLLIDDFIVSMQGGEGVFKDMADWVVNLGTKITNFLLKPIRELLEKFKQLKKGTLASAIFKFSAGDNDKELSGLNSKGAGEARKMSNSFTNNYNINSTASATQLADNIVNKQQKELNYALQEFNNGALY